MTNFLKNIRLRRKKRKTNQTITNIAVIGGGSWATALVKMLTENNTMVHWWMRDKQAVKHIQKFHHNPAYLSGVTVNKRKVKATLDLKEAVKNAEYILIVVPAAFVEDALSPLNAEDFKGKIVISAVKGIIPEKNWLVTELLEKTYQVPREKIGVVAGPCHAEEVALEKQSYLTIASANDLTAQKIADILACRFIKTFVNDDLFGVEYAAVIKNIIALACGICHGLNYGDNFQAVLVTNSMSEIERFVDKIAPQNRNLNASAYLGDLLVTAYSQFSRNRTFGNMIGRGYNVKSAQMEMNMIAEGYYAVRCIYEINKNLQVKMPIVDAVYRILYDRALPTAEIRQLADLLS